MLSALMRSYGVPIFNQSAVEFANLCVLSCEITVFILGLFALLISAHLWGTYHSYLPIQRISYTPHYGQCVDEWLLASTAKYGPSSVRLWSVVEFL